MKVHVKEVEGCKAWSANLRIGRHGKIGSVDILVGATRREFRMLLKGFGQGEGVEKIGACFIHWAKNPTYRKDFTGCIIIALTEANKRDGMSYLAHECGHAAVNYMRWKKTKWNWKQFASAKEKERVGDNDTKMGEEELCYGIGDLFWQCEDVVRQINKRQGKK